MIQLEQLEQLTHAHGPSGDESAICEVIRHLALPYADEVTVDVMGNLMVHKQGTGAKVMLSAHMDSIGFIVTHIEKEGFLRVGRLGGVAPSEALYTPVKFKNGTCGVVAKEEKAKLSSLKLDECYLDIGADSEEAAKKQVVVPVLAEVNVAEEESKFGLKTDEVLPFVREVAAYPHLKIMGLMTIAPYVEDPEENRSVFRRLKQLSVDIDGKNIDNVTMSVLSMGMTGDYEVAVEEGATMVRVGTGIFGARDYTR